MLGILLPVAPLPSSLVHVSVSLPFYCFILSANFHDMKHFPIVQSDP